MRGAQRVLELLAASPDVETLDVTGGAPELNDHFRFLVAGARALGRRSTGSARPQPASAARTARDLLGWVPQLVERDGEMVWTDGARAL